MTQATALTATLKVLGDPTRLRILALLEREELSVGELSRALGMSQSRVSNHLRLLREARGLAERRSGTSTYLRLSRQWLENGDPAAVLWSALKGEVAALPEHAADLGRLDSVTLERARSSSEFFDRVARDWDKIGLDFATGQARERAAAALLPPGLVLADLGCGTGYLARALLGLCERLVCVDRSRAMLAEAQKCLERSARGTRLEFRRGELDDLPIQDGELDGLVAGMVLHHLPDLDRPLREMRRVLKPGGRAALLELSPHAEDWMREAQGDRFLGIDPADVLYGLERAGFERATLEPIDDHYQPRPPAPADGEERARLPLYLVRAHAPA